MGAQVYQRGRPTQKTVNWSETLCQSFYCPNQLSKSRPDGIVVDDTKVPMRGVRKASVSVDGLIVRLVSIS
jgi:hypothetical protein